MHTEETCRVCLKGSDELTPLRRKLPDKSKTLEETINFVVNINIVLENGLPDKICKDCGTMLDVADTFKQRCLESEAMLGQLDKGKDTGEFRPKFEDKTQENSENMCSEDASASCLPIVISTFSLSDSLGEKVDNKENFDELSENKIKMELLEICDIEDETTKEQENLENKPDFEASPSKAKEECLNEAKGFKIPVNCANNEDFLLKPMKPIKLLHQREFLGRKRLESHRKESPDVVPSHVCPPQSGCSNKGASRARSPVPRKKRKVKQLDEEKEAVVLKTVESNCQGVTQSPVLHEVDTEKQLAIWEEFSSNNPGSDDEEDQVDKIQPPFEEFSIDTRLKRTQFPADVHNYFSAELNEKLALLDSENDAALKSLAESQRNNLLDFDWANDTTVFLGKKESFLGDSGPTFSTEGMTPLDIFLKIWDASIIEHIVRETNKYGSELKKSTDLKQCSHIKSWTEVTSSDIMTLFGIFMLQSIIPIPVEKEYWYPCLPYLKVGNFQQIMPYRKFLILKKCLHFTDNTTLASQTPTENLKVLKILPVVEHLNNKFKSLYLPEQTIVIDESLLLWKGRLGNVHLVTIAGIKSLEICESRTGYLWAFEIYTAKTKELGCEVDAETDGSTAKTLYRLVTPLLNLGHTVVLDNLYNSPLLCRIFKAQKTDVIGTLRLNRQFVPECLKNKNKTNIRAGEVASSQTHDLTVVVCNETNVVSLISTFHPAEVGVKEKYSYKPKVVQDFKNSLSGIDKKYQMLQTFPIERINKNGNWYKKLFRRLLNVSIYNAFVIFNTGKNMSQRQFRVQLADEIMKKFRDPNLGKQIVPAASGHFPIRNATGKFRCKWCAIKKIATRTVWKCETCNVDLCIVDCYKKFHLNKSS